MKAVVVPFEGIKRADGSGRPLRPECGRADHAANGAGCTDLRPVRANRRAKNDMKMIRRRRRVPYGSRATAKATRRRAHRPRRRPQRRSDRSRPPMSVLSGARRVKHGQARRSGRSVSEGGSFRRKEACIICPDLCSPTEGMEAMRWLQAGRQGEDRQEVRIAKRSSLRLMVDTGKPRNRTKKVESSRKARRGRGAEGEERAIPTT